MQGREPRILLIDNYDSFTHNLAQLMAALGCRVEVVRNDELRWDVRFSPLPDALVISPGPGGPAAAGSSLSLVRQWAGKIPILGVCLGMQVVNETFGGRTVPAPVPVHGKVSRIRHDGTGLFRGLPSPLEVARYHSLAVAEVPPALRVMAWTEEGLPMALAHESLPVGGVQFHPESFLTPDGAALIRNFIAGLARSEKEEERGGAATETPLPWVIRKALAEKPHSLAVKIIPLPRAGIPFPRLFASWAGEPAAVLLASGGTDTRARFSLMGVSPRKVVTVSGGRLIVSGREGRERTAPFTLEALARVFEEERVDLTLPPGLPFAGGAMGYLGYEWAGEIERLPPRKPSPQEIPDLWWIFPKFTVVRDHASGSDTLVACDAGPEEIQQFLRRWEGAGSGPDPGEGGADPATLEANFSRLGYLAAVEEVREHIQAGDIYQANLSQRFRCRWEGDPYGLFLRLFGANPAAFFAYVKGPGFSLVSTSPERFLARRGDTVWSEPIKGTRPRGGTWEEDRRRREELLGSPKDAAELNMIVDLVRNDLGRVCRPGSVRVAEHRRVESYRNVHHLVSRVEGGLAPGASSLELLAALFPTGSITGCPKLRSMEIIHKLEPESRGIYTGAIGYLGYHDNLDWNVAIRTALVKDGVLSFSAGGGIVYDSDPAAEYEETRHKARSFLEAVEGVGA